MKIIKSTILFALTLLSVALVASSAKASVTIYTDRSAFLAASGSIGTTTTIDFSTKDDGSPITNPSNDVYFETLTLRDVSFKNSRSYYNGFIYNFQSAKIRAELPLNTFAFGGDLTDFYNVGLLYTVTLSTGESFVFPPVTRDWEFFGFISNTPVEWAEFSLTNDYMAIDNFTFVVKPFTDTDGDGKEDSADNCPSMSNPDQADNDSDGQGDACDSDDDNDGVTDGQDAFPFDPNESVDTDADSTGNNADTDDDNDGVADTTETAAGSNPLNSASTPEVCDGADNDLNEGVDEGFINTDGDAMADCVDPDDDNDSISDSDDAFPLDPRESVDTDGDGIGNNADIDDDNDGFSDSTETSSGSDPLNSASTPEICDGRDNDLNDGVDEGFTNTDGDDMADCVDPDDDNDGVVDASDNCPLKLNPDQADFDLDGIGDTCDAQTGPPRNKEQCKDEGWMRFNTPRAFKNQGDCIQFVNTGK